MVLCCLLLAVATLEKPCAAGRFHDKDDTKATQTSLLLYRSLPAPPAEEERGRDRFWGRDMFVYFLVLNGVQSEETMR